MMTADRRTQLTVISAEEALAALLAMGAELRTQVDTLTQTYGDGAHHDHDQQEEAPIVIPTLNHLASRVDALTEEITRLADQQDAHHDRLGVLGRRGFWLASLAVIIAVLLAGIGGLALVRSEVDHLAVEQARQNAEAWCPFFAFIIGTYRPESRPEGEARQEYEAGFAVMRDVYARIPCTGEPLPPAGG